MDPRKILVFQTAFLGDAILSIPLLKKVRRLYPEARLGFVCRAGIGTIFTKGGLVHEVIEVEKNDSKKIAEAFKATKVFGPDLIVSPHRSFRTAFWVWRLKAKMSVGFRDPWSFFAYKKKVTRPKNEHDVLRQLSLLTVLDESAGSPKGEIQDRQADLALNLAANDSFSYLKNFVALSPGSQWETKRWTEEGFVEVGQRLRKNGAAVVILGSSSEKDLCQRISRKIEGSVNLSGQTSILELAQILSQVRLLICNDSGTMHVATAVGTPVVSIFGATVPSQGYAPWSSRAKIVEKDLDCRPCGAHGHKTCPLGHHHCMTFISAGDVLGKAEEFLS